MAILHQVTEGALRQMARDASSMHISSGIELTDAVVKVASSYGEPLTSEHVRRVCEMTYHDVFERAFRDAAGDDRLVSFTPPDAVKAASAIRATQVQTFQNKIAAAESSHSQEMAKVATAHVWSPTPPPNAFSALVGGVEEDPLTAQRESEVLLKKTAAATLEALSTLRTEAEHFKCAGLLAYQDLGRQVHYEVCRNDVPAEMVLSACASFMKEAGVQDDVMQGVLVDLSVDMMSAGIELNEKRASLEEVNPNPNHPLREKAIKVAHLRTERLHREYALQDLSRHQEWAKREHLGSAFLSR
jgi:hypothetical protein